MLRILDKVHKNKQNKKLDQILRKYYTVNESSIVFRGHCAMLFPLGDH